MAKVLHDEVIPARCGVAVEYGIPHASKRIDLLLRGVTTPATTIC